MNKTEIEDFLSFSRMVLSKQISYGEYLDSIENIPFESDSDCDKLFDIIEHHSGYKSDDKKAYAIIEKIEKWLKLSVRNSAGR